MEESSSGRKSIGAAADKQHQQECVEVTAKTIISGTIDRRRASSNSGSSDNGVDQDADIRWGEDNDAVGGMIETVEVVTTSSALTSDAAPVHDDHAGGHSNNIAGSNVNLKEGQHSSLKRMSTSPPRLSSPPSLSSSGVAE